MSDKRAGSLGEGAAQNPSSRVELPTYQLLDSGGGRKLERWGDYVIERQAPAAFWKQRRPELWKKNIDAIHHRSDKGGGHWEFRRKLPSEQILAWGGLRLLSKLTPFGHFGFFAEQAREWQWMRDRFSSLKEAKQSLKQGTEPLRILNLFAYTGGSSLTLASLGAEVTHVDAAQGINDWAAQHVQMNQGEFVDSGKIRLITDDCVRFLKREKKRGSRYQGFVMDPPSYGRGPNKEVFKLEDQVGELIQSVVDVLDESFCFFHFSCHTPGFSPLVLGNLLSDEVSLNSFQCEGSEMWVDESRVEPQIEDQEQHTLPRRLPSGYVFRGWRDI